MKETKNSKALRRAVVCRMLRLGIGCHGRIAGVRCKRCTKQSIPVTHTVTNAMLIS